MAQVLTVVCRRSRPKAVLTHSKAPTHQTVSQTSTCLSGDSVLAFLMFCLISALSSDAFRLTPMIISQDSTLTRKVLYIRSTDTGPILHWDLKSIRLSCGALAVEARRWLSALPDGASVVMSAIYSSGDRAGAWATPDLSQAVQTRDLQETS